MQRTILALSLRPRQKPSTSIKKQQCRWSEGYSDIFSSSPTDFLASSAFEKIIFGVVYLNSVSLEVRETVFRTDTPSYTVVPSKTVKIKRWELFSSQFTKRKRSSQFTFGNFYRFSNFQKGECRGKLTVFSFFGSFARCYNFWFCFLPCWNHSDTAPSLQAQHAPMGYWQLSVHIRGC